MSRAKACLNRKTAKKNLLSKVWRALIRRDPGTDLVDWQLKSIPFNRTYSQDDFSHSDEHHFTKRKSAADLPDIYSLGERLRIVGRLVNAKGGELVHLTKTLNSVSFQYRDKDGVLQSEEYSADDLFRIQQQYSSEGKIKAAYSSETHGPTSADDRPVARISLNHSTFNGAASALMVF